ncbi:MAG TPA: integrase core domain-containing protein [Roseiarcus sp.]|nr:integrase core domain-containing protein [Roseiarcus sp.]
MSRPDGTAVTKSHMPALSPSRKKPRRCALQTYSSGRRSSSAIISAILFSIPRAPRSRMEGRWGRRRLAGARPHGPPIARTPRRNRYDNAKAESFMKTLKQEEVDGRSYRDAQQAKQEIGSFIEEVYNRRRPIAGRVRGKLTFGEPPYDHRKPLARYGAMGGALARGLLRPAPSTTVRFRPAGRVRNEQSM